MTGSKQEYLTLETLDAELAPLVVLSPALPPAHSCRRPAALFATAIIAIVAIIAVSGKQGTHAQAAQGGMDFVMNQEQPACQSDDTFQTFPNNYTCEWFTHHQRCDEGEANNPLLDGSSRSAVAVCCACGGASYASTGRSVDGEEGGAATAATGLNDDCMGRTVDGDWLGGSGCTGRTVDDVPCRPTEVNVGWCNPAATGTLTGGAAALPGSPDEVHLPQTSPTHLSPAEFFAAKAAKEASASAATAAAAARTATEAAGGESGHHRRRNHHKHHHKDHKHYHKTEQELSELQNHLDRQDQKLQGLAGAADKLVPYCSENKHWYVFVGKGPDKQQKWCLDFEKEDQCKNPSWNTLKYNAGANALEACCACGGGEWHTGEHDEPQIEPETIPDVSDKTAACTACRLKEAEQSLFEVLHEQKSQTKQREAHEKMVDEMHKRQRWPETCLKFGGTCSTLTAEDNKTCIGHDGRFTTDLFDCLAVRIVGERIRRAMDNTCLCGSPEKTETWGFYDCHGGQPRLHFNSTGPKKICSVASGTSTMVGINSTKMCLDTKVVADGSSSSSNSSSSSSSSSSSNDDDLGPLTLSSLCSDAQRDLCLLEGA